MQRILFAVFVVIVFASLFWRLQSKGNNFIIVQSSTSTQNSGLYDFLIPKFKAATNIDVRVIAVGTGQALKNAERCDGDMLIVHSRKAEDTFVAAGYGVERYDLMHNKFVIVGPDSDPANVSAASNVNDALRSIYQGNVLFVSRGDDSGTHKREMELWQRAGVGERVGDWYRETGSGQGATLNSAAAMNGYALTDFGTWAAHKNQGNLRILFQKGMLLKNPYGVIVVDPNHCPNVKTKLATRFQDWLLSSEGQAAIGSFQINGKVLFFPTN